jgi:hypothetical protein
MTIYKIYNTIIFNYTNSNLINRLIYRLNLLSLALYLKNLTKDKRNLSQLASIIKEEYKL